LRPGLTTRAVGRDQDPDVVATRYRVEFESGRRTLWRTLSPADPVGVEFGGAASGITPDASAYCYSYLRRLGDLFVIDGLT
jgi:hypothetical protein